jgi:hypothetical protein
MPLLLSVISDPNASPLAVEGVTAELMRLAALGDENAEIKRKWKKVWE